MLKSVLSVVLAVGAAALCLYTATQVFGWELVPGTAPRTPAIQPRSAAPGQWPTPPAGYPSSAWPQQQQQGGYPPQQQQQSPYDAPQQPAWQWQPSYGNDDAAPSAPPMPQGDVVDVWYGGGAGGGGGSGGGSGSGGGAGGR
jgi:hypothetical protein